MIYRIKVMRLKCVCFKLGIFISDLFGLVKIYKKIKDNKLFYYFVENRKFINSIK